MCVSILNDKFFLCSFFLQYLLFLTSYYSSFGVRYDLHCFMFISQGEFGYLGVGIALVWMDGCSGTIIFYNWWLMFDEKDLRHPWYGLSGVSYWVELWHMRPLGEVSGEQYWERGQGGVHGCWLVVSNTVSSNSM